jgi:hypothetical protein
MKKPGPLQSVPGLSWRLLAAHTGDEIPPRITGTDLTRDKIARSRRYLAGRRGTKRQYYFEANCWLVSDSRKHFARVERSVRVRLLVALLYASVLVRNGPTGSPVGGQPTFRGNHHQPSARQKPSKLPIPLGSDDIPGIVLPISPKRNGATRSTSRRYAHLKGFYWEHGKYCLSGFTWVRRCW